MSIFLLMKDIETLIYIVSQQEWHDLDRLDLTEAHKQMLRGLCLWILHTALSFCKWTIFVRVIWRILMSWLCSLIHISLFYITWSFFTTVIQIIYFMFIFNWGAQVIGKVIVFCHIRRFALRLVNGVHSNLMFYVS